MLIATVLVAFDTAESAKRSSSKQDQVAKSTYTHQKCLVHAELRQENSDFLMLIASLVLSRGFSSIKSLVLKVLFFALPYLRLERLATC